MMRKLEKYPIPEVLEENFEIWTKEFQDDPHNQTKRLRYRHPDIKSQLRNETGNKCVYCESKVGHNTPGDIEHKIPSSVDRRLHFSWDNLTLACSECNRRKNAYFDPQAPFLDPYEDKVEELVVHHGPIVGWREGDERAEVTVRTLQLHNETRLSLVLRKIERINEVNDLIAR